MLNNGLRFTRENNDDAEKPFWISFADLMTALMVLFLVVMVASLLSLTNTLTSLEESRSQADVLAGKYTALKKQEDARAQTEDRHAKRIDRFWGELDASTKNLGVRINREARLINFGDRARFGSGSDDLSARDQVLLRRFVPRLLQIGRSEVGQQVLSRVVVEGYADRRGSYLYNLNLSSNRSQRVLCVLLQPGGASSLSNADKTLVRDLFLVGGFSFNSRKRSLEESRRVEIRLEFLRPGQKRAARPKLNTQFGDCPL